MRSARRAVRVLAQLQLAKLHPQGIDQQQPPDQRFARAQDQLDHFGGLHHAHQSRKNPEHSAFGA
jgi:hypothetical protein